MDKRDEKIELLAAFALGSLDDIKAQEELAAQIESDPQLAAELQEWQDVAANLAFIVPAAEPSPAVRDNILAAIRKTPLLVNSNQNQTSNLEAVEVSKNSPPLQEKSKNASVLKFPGFKKTSFWNFAPVFGTVAASIVALFLGVMLYNTVQSNKSKNEQITALSQKISDVQIQLQREREERELLASPATFVKTLDGTKEIPAAKARLVFDPKTGQALLYVEGLPAAPQGKAYQIWFISDPKHPAPGKTFETDQSGKGALREQIPAQSLKAIAFAITLEPQSGSLTPTAPVLLSTVSS